MNATNPYMGFYSLDLITFIVQGLHHAALPNRDRPSFRVPNAQIHHSQALGNNILRAQGALVCAPRPGVLRAREILCLCVQGKKGVLVDEVKPGGHSDGKLQVGDVLVSCSAVVLKAGKEGRYEKEGYAERPYDNWEVINFPCLDQASFSSLGPGGIPCPCGDPHPDSERWSHDCRNLTPSWLPWAANNERWGFNEITVEVSRGGDV